MYSSQLQLKFSNVSEAKIAAQSLCELLKSRISVFDFHGLQVTVGKDGDLSISVRFQDVKAMNDFEKDIPKVIEDINKARYAIKRVLILLAVRLLSTRNFY